MPQDRFRARACAWKEQIPAPVCNCNLTVQNETEKQAKSNESSRKIEDFEKFKSSLPGFSPQRRREELLKNNTSSPDEALDPLMPIS